jgi:ABC-2 type transport system ATP-binding protein
METQSHAVELEGVVKRYGTTVALDRLSLSIARGTVFGVLGPNGAGKTTMLKVLLGLAKPEEGRARVLDLDPVVDGQRVRGQVGVLLEHDGLYDRLSARGNLDFHAAIQHVDKAARAPRIEKLLRTFGLWDRRDERPAGWSTGMRKKLAIARSILHAPRLLLLDEPFSGLDPAAAVDLRELIARHAAEETVTIIMTTHDLAHAERVCARVAVIGAGRVLAEGPPDRLGQKNGAHAEAAPVELEITGEGLSEALLERLRAEELVLDYRLNGRVALVTCTPTAAARVGTELVKAGVLLEQLRKTGRSLEDAVLAVMRDGGGQEKRQ